ncbi:MAG: WxL domain-containing protein [Candidatus Dormibacteria bacterium]
MPSPSTTETVDMSRVACESSSDCWAVGYFSNGTVDQTLIEQYNGTSWSIVTSPNTSTTNTNVLNDVYCVSASDCWAAGYASNGTTDQTLIEQWNGTNWSIVSSPDTSTSETNYLGGVSCVSSSACWAAGGYYNGSIYQPLIEQFSGTSWSIATIAASTTSSNFFSISCSSSTMCVAVGNDTNFAFSNTSFSEVYNGTSWSIVSVPAVGSSTNALNDVYCVSATECWAAGFWNDTAYNSGDDRQMLIEEFNGSAWSIAQTQDVGVNDWEQFIGVTCASALQCWATGGVAGSPYSTFTQGFPVIESLGQLTATVPIVAGTLSFVTPPANLGFSTVPLTGSNQTATATETLDIGDNTGSGSGWDVTVSNTPFTNGTQTLPNSDFTAASPSTPVCDSGVTCTPATWSGSVGYPYTLPGSTATKLLSAAATTGMANQTVTIAWSASIPANTYAGTYTSTWTLTLASGP